LCPTPTEIRSLQRQTDESRLLSVVGREHEGNKSHLPGATNTWQTQGGSDYKVPGYSPYQHTSWSSAYSIQMLIYLGWNPNKLKYLKDKFYLVEKEGNDEGSVSYHGWSRN